MSPRFAWLFCRQLMPLARAIDKLGELLGVIASFLVLFACLVSAGNATIRDRISNSSNAWLELPWYMFAGMVLIGGAFPPMVTYWLEKPVAFDPAAVQKQFDNMPSFGTIDLQGLAPPTP